MEEPNIVASPVALATLDNKGNVPRGRLRDAASARAIRRHLVTADETSAINRRRNQAMFDGEPPYSAARQKLTLQAQSANLNFGEARRWMEVATSGYVGLINGVETLLRCKATQGTLAEQKVWENIIAAEYSHMVRSWPAFDHKFLLLAQHFIGHGVGVTYFETDMDWRWNVCGLSDFVFPRQTPATETAIEIAFAKKEYYVHELYALIRDEEAAAEVGWNVELVKQAIREAAATGYTSDEIEKVQQELKNNDLFCSVKSATIKVIHTWVRELDGSISHYIATEDACSNARGDVSYTDDFLYKRLGRFESSDRAYILFAWGVGTNGTYHSVRGLGHRIFAQIQEANKLGCRLLDGAKLAASVVIQPENQHALDNLAISYYGPYAVLGPNVKVIEKAIPNLGTAVVPALNDLRSQVAANMDFYSTDGVFSNPTRAERTRFEVEAALEQSSRLSMTSMNLFYPSLTRLLRESLRRATDPDYDSTDGGWEEVQAFRQRCIERGVPEEVLFSLDHSRTRAVRAVGNGSIGSQVTSLRNLMELMPSFDEVGRKNVLYDRVAAEVGYDQVERYVSQVDERPTQDQKIAELENFMLLQGGMISVSSIDLPMAHLNVHLTKMLELLDEINKGTVDPREVLQGLLSLFDHCNGHYDQIAGDPSLQAFAAQVRETLQQAGEIIHNANKEIEAENRHAMQNGEGAEAAPQGGGLSPEAQQKLDEHNLKLQMMKEKAKVEADIKWQKAEQERILADAAAAAKIRDKIR